MPKEKSQNEWTLEQIKSEIEAIKADILRAENLWTQHLKTAHGGIKPLTCHKCLNLEGAIQANLADLAELQTEIRKLSINSSDSI